MSLPLGYQVNQRYQQEMAKVSIGKAGMSSWWP